MSTRKSTADTVPAGLIRAILIHLWRGLILLGSLHRADIQSLVTNLIWNNTRIGEHRIECNMSPAALIWIALSNLVLVVLTLGVSFRQGNCSAGEVSARSGAASAGRETCRNS